MIDIELAQLAPNYTMVDLGRVRIWFSYSTPIAFNDGTGTGTVVRENVWGPTTGKHINRVDGGDAQARAARLNSNDFEARLTEVLA